MSRNGFEDPDTAVRMACEKHPAGIGRLILDGQGPNTLHGRPNPLYELSRAYPIKDLTSE